MVDRCDLDRHRFLVVGRLLEGEDELAEILNGVDVVVGRRRDGVGTHRDHPGLGNLVVDLLPGQMAADARLGALANLDLDGDTGVEILLAYAEAARGHLDHDIGAVPVEVFVKPPSPVL